MRRMIAAVEDARVNRAATAKTKGEATGSSADTPEHHVAQPCSSIDTIERESVVKGIGSQESGQTCYIEANFAFHSRSTSIPEMPIAELAQIVLKVVSIEGPIHGDETARRITTLFGQVRSGSRITAAVNLALTSLVKRRDLMEQDGFYWPFDQLEFQVRDRENVSSSTLKKPELLPPKEIQAGVVRFVDRHVGATIDECTRGVSRELGFRSTGQQLRQIIEKQIEFLVAHQKLTLNGTVLAGL